MAPLNTPLRPRLARGVEEAQEFIAHLVGVQKHPQVGLLAILHLTEGQAADGLDQGKGGLEARLFIGIEPFAPIAFGAFARRAEVIGDVIVGLRAAQSSAGKTLSGNTPSITSGCSHPAGCGRTPSPR